jgi:hypothetical protein
MSEAESRRAITTTEELLIAKWCNLPQDKQQEAFAFVDRLSRPNTDSPLGQKLRAIRAKIVESGYRF